MEAVVASVKFESEEMFLRNLVASLSRGLMQPFLDGESFNLARLARSSLIFCRAKDLFRIGVAGGSSFLSPSRLVRERYGVVERAVSLGELMESFGR